MPLFLRRAAPLLHFVFAATSISLVCGCHSAYVIATVENRLSSPVSLVQVEYPSANFGVQAISSGQDFKYRFKIIGSGQMKIVYTDSLQIEHKATGPTLDEGTEGSLEIKIAPDGVHWALEPLKK